MPHLSDEAICIRHWDYSETSQTVSLFSRGHGVFRGLAKGAKRAGGRFSGGIDLMTRGQVVAIVKAGRELSTLTDWTLIGTFRSLRTNLDANRAGYYMIDLVQRFIGDADPHPRLYDGLIACLERIDAGEECAPWVLLFQWLALDEGGYRPTLEPSAEEGQTVHFSAEAGGISTTGWKVRKGTLDLLRGIARCADRWTGGDAAQGSEATTLADVVGSVAKDASPDAIGRANRLLAAYIRHVMGGFPETMRALFPDP